MIRANRPPEPAVLAANAARWTSAWAQRRGANPNAAFAWPQVGGEPLNRHLLPPLRAMTEDRCAWCDAIIHEAEYPPTIDHFRPKSVFVDLAFAWPNLFPACPACQSLKADRWDDAALHPDHPDYDFSRYFRYLAATGTIEPNPEASPEDRARAIATIALFGLNLGPRPRARKRAMQMFAALDPADRPYRFIYDTPYPP